MAGLGSRGSQEPGAKCLLKGGHGWSLEMASNTERWDVAEMSASQTGGARNKHLLLEGGKQGQGHRQPLKEPAGCQVVGAVSRGRSWPGLVQGQDHRAPSVDGQMVRSKMGGTTVLAARVCLGP